MRKQGNKTNKTNRGYLIIAIALSVLAFATGYNATAEQYDPKEYPQNYIDVFPKDYADPNKYDPKNERRTPEGIQYASPTSRAGTLQKTYTELHFDTGKVFGDIKAATGGEKCLSCHSGIEEISPSHAKMSCTECHAGSGSSEDMKTAHNGMVSNPSDLSVADRTCGKCHKDHVAHVGGSLMATSAGEINSTRYLWGAQDSPKAVYAAKAAAGLKAMPDYAQSKEPVDDFLGKKCLRCHLNSPAPKRLGEYRATGCAACHMVYSNDGRTNTGDKAILSVANKTPEKIDVSGIHPSTKRGYPLLHKFTAAVPSLQCVRCHSGNRTGSQYIGITEHDFEQMYRSPRDQGKSPSTIYGIEQHHLKADIHFEKGMHCIDCHNQSEVEGDGKSYSLASQAVKVRCQDCHGTPMAKPKTMAADAKAVKVAKSNPNYSVNAGDKVAVTSGGDLLANVKEEGGRLVLTSKVTGKKHTVPLLAEMTPQPANHQVAAHMNKMECHACHARWESQDWGLHLMREDYAGFDKWKRWREPDPQTMSILYSAHGSGLGDEVGKPNTHILAEKAEKAPAPVMMNWLTGESSTGVWYSAWSVRNWEDVVLGYNSRGNVSIFAPQYQYFISHIGPDFMDANKEVKALEGKIAGASEEEKLVLKAQLVEAKKKVDSQILKDSIIPKTKDGRIGWAMNPVAPHTTGKAVRSCEKCHQNGNAAGLGQTQYLRAGKKNVPLMENARMGLPIDFQLSQMVAENGDVLQSTTHEGARPFNAGEIKALMGKSKAYRAFRYMALAEGNYLTVKDRKNLTGGLKRDAIPDVSLGDVREVGSYYDWKRYGFWQTDPAIFKDEYFTSPDAKKMKTDFSKDPVIIKEKKGIEEQSLTFGDEINPDWRPKK